jgi:hypothetical protein
MVEEKPCGFVTASFYMKKFYGKGCHIMLQKSGFAFVALLGLVSAGCQTPYGGGCSGGSCAAGGGAAYAPATQTYAPASTYQQQALPQGFGGGGGSGSR